MIGGRYRKVRVIGRGGMGEVFLAEDTLLDREVAVKHILKTDEDETTAVQRLLREARSAARIHHPNVVAVHDLVVEGDDAYVVMEYVPAENLAQILRRGPITPERAARIGAQVADALAAAHRLGIVHRDVKPSNILVETDDRAKLMDFGIARTVNDATLTRTGHMIGSVAYMAPEVAQGEAVTPAADLHSLGATLYTAVDGHPPFASTDEPSTSVSMLVRLVTESAPRATKAGPLTDLIARLLRGNPDERPSAMDVATELRSVFTGAPTQVVMVEPNENESILRTRVRPPVVTATTTSVSLTPPVGADEIAASMPREHSPDDPTTGPPQGRDEDRTVLRQPAPASAARPTSSAPAGPRSGSKGSGRSARPAVLAIAAVAVVALLVAAGAWLFTQRSGAPSGGPTNPDTAPALDPLVDAADLGTLGGVTWIESTATSDPVRPLCLPATGDGVPQAQRSMSRKTTSSDGESALFVQVIDTYPDEATATRAYSARTVQASTCSDDVAWITGANSVSGLADAAISERLVVEGEAADTFHTLLISRTGRSVSLVDIATTMSAVSALDLAEVVGKALSGQCGGDQGTCPSSIDVATVPPPAGDPAGWLVEGDVPRVTPGTGRWGANDPKTTLDVVGSQCEAMNLQAVSGTESARQRTLLLADDDSAPNGFGIDMVTYTFGSAKDAAKLGKKLSTNISQCPGRARTAKVTDGPAANGTGETGLEFTGDTYEVTQDTESETLIYRIAVLTVDDKVVYLMANPTADFDFTDRQWEAISLRAGQRATQS